VRRAPQARTSARARRSRRPPPWGRASTTAIGARLHQGSKKEEFPVITLPKKMTSAETPMPTARAGIPAGTCDAAARPASADTA
jgi:hypothetical protein